LSLTLWKRKDLTFVEVHGLFTEEVRKVYFEIVFLVEIFLAEMVRNRTKYWVLRKSQVWRIRWMGKSDSSKLQ
jgi:hypothetical protein